jgi:hypothetical protein
MREVEIVFAAVLVLRAALKMEVEFGILPRGG